MAKNKKDSGVIHTVIGPQTTIKGTIDSQNSIRIEGIFEGTINSDGEIYVGDGAKLKGNVFGRTVVVAGEVLGPIEARNGLEITGTGKVYGDITGDRLVIDEGAIFKGQVHMDIITSKKNVEAPSKL